MDLTVADVVGASSSSSSSSKKWGTDFLATTLSSLWPVKYGLTFCRQGERNEFTYYKHLHNFLTSDQTEQNRNTKCDKCFVGLLVCSENALNI